MKLGALDRSAQTNRWRHWPAAEKLCLAGGIVVAAFVADTPLWHAVLVLCVILALWHGAGIALSRVLAAIALPTGFLAAGGVVQIVSIDPSAPAPYLALAGPETLSLALETASRSLAAASGLILLALTTPVTSLLPLMGRIGLPAEIGDIAYSMVRFLWLFAELLERGRAALGARLGFATRRQSLASSGLLLAGLLPRALSRSRRLQFGLAARGYQSSLAVLSPEMPARLSRALLFLAGPVVVAVILLFIRSL